MADTSEQAQPSGEQPQPAAEPREIPTAEQQPESHTNEASNADFDHGLPPIDKTFPTSEESVPAIDTSLPSIESTIPALPPIDTSLPPLDTTLPAMDDGEHFSFDRLDEEEPNGGMGEHGVGGHENQHIEQHGSSSTPGAQNPAGSNGLHPQPSGQQQSYEQQQQPPQHHYSPQQNAPTQQPQGQMHQQMQQHSDMYNNQNNASPSNPSTQGQPSQIPQAPIGSPMPPMSSVSQYMAGYPMNSGGQMHYQLQGDANKMLSNRHKKEVKRRTKTGCLTCRKRRIKVRQQFLVESYCTPNFKLPKTLIGVCETREREAGACCSVFACVAKNLRLASSPPPEPRHLLSLVDRSPTPAAHPFRHCS
ncbi:hypothetical protein BDV18DRAFT_97861 [Aspergillus unguis]